jgi:hypothetical protein
LQNQVISPIHQKRTNSCQTGCESTTSLSQAWKLRGAARHRSPIVHFSLLSHVPHFLLKIAQAITRNRSGYFALN